MIHYLLLFILICMAYLIANVILYRNGKLTSIEETFKKLYSKDKDDDK